MAVKVSYSIGAKLPADGATQRKLAGTATSSPAFLRFTKV